MSIFSTLVGDLKLGIADIWGVIGKLGITPQEADTAVVTLVNVGLADAEAPLIHQLVLGYKTPAVVTDIISAALLIPNLPADVKTLLQDIPQLATEAAADPTTGLAAFMNTVSDIETKLGIAA
jgi:hypothetical protein